MGTENQCLIVAAGQRRANVIQCCHGINEKIVNASALCTYLFDALEFVENKQFPTRNASKVRTMRPHIGFTLLDNGSSARHHTWKQRALARVNPTLSNPQVCRKTTNFKLMSVVGMGCAVLSMRALIGETAYQE